MNTARQERVVVVDTETTGFSPQWDRVIEFAAAEVEPHSGLKGAELHHVINPKRPIPPATTKVHGLRDDDVRDKPPFPAVAAEIAGFLRGSVLVIQNAAFDVGMLDAELARAGYPQLTEISVAIVDTLEISRNVFPLWPKHDLDTMCDQLGVSRSVRSNNHSALIDVRLLAATLPRLATEYDALLSSVEGECAVPLVRFEHELTNYLEQLVMSVDQITPKKLEFSISRLSAAERWITVASKWFNSALDGLLDKESHWACDHFSVRCGEATSIPWKDVAVDHLSPKDMDAYQSRSVSRRYVPKADASVSAKFGSLQPLFEQSAVAASISCVVRGLVILKSAQKRLEAERGVLRERLMENVDAGYQVREGALDDVARTNTDYRRAVTDLRPNIDLTRYQTKKLSRSVAARNLRACEALFG